MNNPNIKNKRIPDDEFNAIRADVLKQWPTGREVDLKEAIEYKDNVMKFKVKDGVFVRENEEDFYIPKVVTEAPVSPTKAPEIKHKEDKTKKKADKKTKEEKKSEEVGVTVMESGKNVSNLSFNQEKGIMWPVSGEILMKYSADNAVYFKTLGQYKTNPALIISAEKGTSVASAAESVVTEVGENEEIGKYVETSLGDNYKIIYGQLDNIQVGKGDSLSEGEIIGVIAEPTKYYVEEGSNLYMEMLNGKENVDPLIFLR